MGKKLLWIGDAVVASGFARITHHVLDVVRREWDIAVLGMNYDGDPHTYPYPVFPAMAGGDAFGVRRTRDLVERIKPDLVVIQQDPWNIPMYVHALRKDPEQKHRPVQGDVVETIVPVVGAIAVDGKNCSGKKLNGLRHVIFWTKFGQREGVEGGYVGTSDVIPLGVDLATYRPVPLMMSRNAIGLGKVPEDAFIFGNVNRNQPRKRLDLTIEYFCRWVRESGADNAYLFLHVAPTGDLGYNVQQLFNTYYGLEGRLILSNPEVNHGMTETGLNLLYNCFNAQISTTQGEGWGLTTLEGMACGIAQIAPDWSGLGDWGRHGDHEGIHFVPCSTTAVTPSMVNVVGGVPDREPFIAALDRVYRDEDYRVDLARRGRALAIKDEYRWENVGQRYLEVLNAL